MALCTALLMLLAASATTAAPYPRDSCGKPVVRVYTYTSIIHKPLPTTSATPFDTSDLNKAALDYPPVPNVTTLPSDTKTISSLVLDTVTLETAPPLDTTAITTPRIDTVTLETATTTDPIPVSSMVLGIAATLETARPTEAGTSFHAHADAVRVKPDNEADTTTIVSLNPAPVTLETATPTNPIPVSSMVLDIAVTPETATPTGHVVAQALDAAVPVSPSTPTTELTPEPVVTSLEPTSVPTTSELTTSEGSTPDSISSETIPSLTSTSKISASPSTSGLATPTSDTVVPETVASDPATSESTTLETTSATTPSLMTITATSTTRSTSTITTRATTTVTVTSAGTSQAASSTEDPGTATSGGSTTGTTLPAAVPERHAKALFVANDSSPGNATSQSVASESTIASTTEPVVESTAQPTSSSTQEPTTASSTQEPTTASSTQEPTTASSTQEPTPSAAVATAASNSTDSDALPEPNISLFSATDDTASNAYLNPSLPSGFTRTLFRSTFSSSLPDSWIADIGTAYESNGETGPSDWGTGEHQSYTSSTANLRITSHSTLLITPLYDSDTQTWTSARIETDESDDFSCPEGSKLRIEASIKLGTASEDEQKGIWPAFWSLGSGYRTDPWSWPGVGELDIMESVNGLDTIWQTVHCGEADGGPCHEATGLSSSTGFSRGEWHIVALEIDRTNGDGWEKESIVWYVDGRETKRLYGGDVGDEDAWGSLAHDERFLLLNVAVGGGMPDGVSGQSTPNAGTRGGEGSGMEVGYVGVYAS